MRSTRLITALLAVLVMLGASLSTGSAQAAEPAAKARPAHVVKGLKAAEIRNSGKFFVRGYVTTFQGRAIRLQKANCGKCTFRPYKLARTSRANGKFRITFDGKIGSWFRIKVPATKTRRVTYIKVGKIVRGA